MFHTIQQCTAKSVWWLEQISGVRCEHRENTDQRSQGKATLKDTRHSENMNAIRTKSRTWFRFVKVLEQSPRTGNLKVFDFCLCDCVLLGTSGILQQLPVRSDLYRYIMCWMWLHSLVWAQSPLKLPDFKCSAPSWMEMGTRMSWCRTLDSACLNPGQMWACPLSCTCGTAQVCVRVHKGLLLCSVSPLVLLWDELPAGGALDSPLKASFMDWSDCLILLREGAGFSDPPPPPHLSTCPLTCVFPSVLFYCLPSSACWVAMVTLLSD